MLEYRFETISTNIGGYGFIGGMRVDTEDHRAVIQRMAAEGWRYAGFLPTSQRGTGHIEEMDLIFEREREEEAST